MKLSTTLSLLVVAAGLAAPAADTPPPLSLPEARAIALQKHPRISVAELQALVAKQAVRETQAAFFPNLSANFAGVGVLDADTRMFSSSLPISSVFDRASASVNLTQLVTDFGRTANLAASSRLHARAEERNLEATRAQIVLQVDAAYYGVLQAESVLRVAQETVQSRQVLRDQVSVLARSQLRSDLDASFAEVGLQEAQLAQLKTENDVQSSFAVLAALLGSRETEAFRLAGEPPPPALGTNVSEHVAAALRDRPDLLRLRLERDSARAFAKAERGLHYPTLSIQGAAGVAPYHDPDLNHDYAAAGIILSLPLFNGNLYDARDKAAGLRAQAAGAALEEEENNVVRDVRIAWFGATNSRERLAVTARLLEQARLSFALADARYKAGSSSMVELSQAQLNLTSAELTLAVARYEYLVRLSILAFQTGQLK